MKTKNWLTKTAVIAALISMASLPLIGCGPAAPDIGTRSLGAINTASPTLVMHGSLTYLFPNRHTFDFQTVGTVTSVLVTRGDRVKAGQLLATLDGRSQKLALDNARDNVTMAKNNFAKRVCPPWGVCAINLGQKNSWDYFDTPGVDDTLEIMQGQMDVAAKAMDSGDYAEARKEIAALQDNLARARNILENSYIKEFVYGITENVFIQYTLQLDQANIAFQGAEIDYKKTQLVAPFDGVVDDVTVKVGDVISAVNQTSLPAVSLIDTSVVQMEGSVDETDLQSMQVGQKATVTVDQLPNAKFNGTINYVSKVAAMRAGVPYFNYGIALDPPYPADLRQGLRATASLAARVSSK
jgi:multidrug efflux pump subunit AcrA (membrane-fusion protein)